MACAQFLNWHVCLVGRNDRCSGAFYQLSKAIATYRQPTCTNRQKFLTIHPHPIFKNANPPGASPGSQQGNQNSTFSRISSIQETTLCFHLIASPYPTNPPILGDLTLCTPPDWETPYTRGEKEQKFSPRPHMLMHSQPFCRRSLEAAPLGPSPCHMRDYPAACLGKQQIPSPIRKGERGHVAYCAFSVALDWGVLGRWDMV